MKSREIIKQVKELLKNSQTESALTLLKEHPEDERCQATLREYYIGEMDLQNAIPLAESMSRNQTVEGLISSSFLHLLQQNLQAAVETAQNAIRQDPDNCHAYNHLARALQNSGQSNRALENFAKAVAIDPDYPQAWHNLGHTQRAIGQLGVAISSYKNAVEHFPQYQSALYNMAVTYSAQQNYQHAEKIFDNLLEINPNHLLGLVNAGLNYHHQGNFAEADKCYMKALELDSNFPLTYCYKGILHNELQETEPALQYLHKAVELNPNEVEAWCELANVYEKNNNLQNAAYANQRALSIDPQNPTALIDLARIKRRENQPQQALEILQKVFWQSLSLNKQIEYWFENAEIFDKVGDYQNAFLAYSQANRLASESPRFKQINPKSFDESLQEIRNWIAAKNQNSQDTNTTADSGKDLCFLIGFPRSGTTLIDTILSSHDSIVSIEEKPTIETLLNHLKEKGQNYWSLTEPMDSKAKEELQSMYRDMIGTYADTEDKIILDKLPLRFLQSGFIHELFPEARFIFMQRHPMDAILSNFFQNYAPTKAFVHFGTLEKSAEMYLKTVSLWQDLKENLAGKLIEVRYEDLTDNPEKTIKNVCEFLGIEFDESMLDKDKRLRSRNRISTNSYAQVPDDIYLHSQNRWKNYQTFFEPLKGKLESVVKSLNYKFE